MEQALQTMLFPKLTFANHAVSEADYCAERDLVERTWLLAQGCEHPIRMHGQICNARHFATGHHAALPLPLPLPRSKPLQRPARPHKLPGSLGKRHHMPIPEITALHTWFATSAGSVHAVNGFDLKLHTASAWPSSGNRVAANRFWRRSSPLHPAAHACRQRLLPALMRGVHRA